MWLIRRTPAFAESRFRHQDESSANRLAIGSHAMRAGNRIAPGKATRSGIFSFRERSLGGIFGDLPGTAGAAVLRLSRNRA